VLRDAAGITRIETSMIRGGERSRKFALDSLYRLVLYQDGAANWVDPTALSPPASPVDPVAAGGQGILNAAIGDLSLPADQAVYEYDDTGNRVATREPGTPPFDCVSDALNQYTDVGGVPWHYDASGNLRSDGIWTFLYDLHDALSIVANARTGVRQASYYRDALGRVVAEVTPANTVFRISDGNIALVEMDARSRTEYTTQPIDEMVVHVASGGEDYWITRDKRGSLRLLTDSQGHLVAIPSYRPYGTAEDGELGFSPLRLAFGAMWFTPGLPFLHTRSRAYRTDLGRFLQRDPLGQAGGLNLYVYGGNNPVDRWDPSGLQDELDDLVDLQLSPVSLQYPSSSPLSLSTDPNEFRLQLIGDRTDLTDFQKDLMLSRAAQDVTGNVAARLTEDVFSADKIKAGLLVNLLGPPLVAGLLANPLGSIIDFTVGEMVKSGTKSALDSLGVDEQTSEWIATGAQLLSGPLVNAAVGKAAQALINAQVGAEFENYVEATVLAEYDEAQLLESQRSFATPFFEAIKWRVRPDWNIFNEDYQLAWIADAKTSDFIPFDLQAEAFVDIAASTTTKTLVYFVPGAATADILDKKLLEYALEAKVTLKVIQVP
jgi:RHS repeat-associated protein